MSIETTYTATLKPSELGFEVPQTVITMSEYRVGIRTVPSFPFLTRVKGNSVPAFLQLVFYFRLPCTGLSDSGQTRYTKEQSQKHRGSLKPLANDNKVYKVQLPKTVELFKTF